MYSFYIIFKWNYIVYCWWVENEGISTTWRMYKWCRKFVSSSNYLKKLHGFFTFYVQQCWNQKTAWWWLLQIKSGTEMQFEVRNCIFVNTGIFIYSAASIYVIGMYSSTNYAQNSTIELQWINVNNILYVVISTILGIQTLLFGHDVKIINVIYLYR